MIREEQDTGGGERSKGIQKREKKNEEKLETQRRRRGGDGRGEGMSKRREAKRKEDK